MPGSGGRDGATNMATWLAYEMSHEKEELAAGAGWRDERECVLTQTP